MSQQIIKKSKKVKRPIEFIIVDEFKIIIFPDEIWSYIKDYVGFFTKPQIYPSWTFSGKLCLAIHWTCKKCNKDKKTQHNPNKQRVRQLLNETALHQLCMMCDGSWDTYLDSIKSYL